MNAAIIVLGLTTAIGQTEKSALKAKLKDEAGERWVYDDLAKGFAEAKASGKPMLVVIRCTH
jgi:serine protease Do